MNCKSFQSIFNLTFIQQRTLSTVSRHQKIWSADETKKLLSLIDIHGTNWVFLLSHFPDRGRKSLESRYRLLRQKSAEELKVILDEKKLPYQKIFTSAEDMLLSDSINKEKLDLEQIYLKFPDRTKVELSERYAELVDEPLNRRGPWTADESNHFRSLFAIYGEDFERISTILKTRSIKQCQVRHTYLSNLSMPASKLTDAQKKVLKETVEKYGPEDFKLILRKAKLPYSLIAEDVRKYYWKELDPKIVVGEWEDHEVEFMIRLLDELDGCMELVQARLPIKRGLNDMWTHYYEYMKKKSLL